nr:archaellin/type IV pilin N-terminal domain-containing protein [Haloferax profundi]
MDAAKFISQSRRAQVGIGTLIVFIAMVLVAAIAAGVLVDTAGVLQDQAQDTGQQSSAQVTDRLNVISIYGSGINEYDTDADATDGSTGDPRYTTGGSEFTGVEDINFIVKKDPGAGSIQMDKVTLNYLGPEGAEQIVLSDKAVTIDSIDGASNDILSDSSDRAKISVNLNPEAVDTGGTADPDAWSSDVFKPLEPGQTATFEFTTEAGATVSKTVNIPPTTTSNDNNVML